MSLTLTWLQWLDLTWLWLGLDLVLTWFIIFTDFTWSYLLYLSLDSDLINYTDWLDSDLGSLHWLTWLWLGTWFIILTDLSYTYLSVTDLLTEYSLDSGLYSTDMGLLYSLTLTCFIILTDFTWLTFSGSYIYYTYHLTDSDFTDHINLTITDLTHLTLT